VPSRTLGSKKEKKIFVWQNKKKLSRCSPDNRGKLENVHVETHRF